MAHPQIAVFARLANGNAKTIREISGQNTMITRTIHDMAYNPIRDEFVIPQFYAQAIMTYRGGANGDEAPIRVIHGPDTQITNPDRVGLDPIHKEIFVPLGNQVLVFPSEAEGNVPPIRVLKGPDTLLGASSVAVDPVHDLLIVSGSPRGIDEERRGMGEDRGRRGHVLIFNRTDAGNIKPLAVIRGPKTQLTGRGLITVYPPRELILVSAPSAERSSPNNFVGVWSEHDNGDVPARWTIGGPDAMLRQAHGIALDPKSKTVIIADKYLNAVLTYYFPEIY